MNVYHSCPTRRMVGKGRPLVPEILAQTDPVRAKMSIFSRYSISCYGNIRRRIAQRLVTGLFRQCALGVILSPARLSHANPPSYEYETETHTRDRNGQMHGCRRAQIRRVILSQLNGLTRRDRGWRGGAGVGGGRRAINRRTNHWRTH